MNKRQISILLPDIRSAHNVGSIFRTSDACGITKIYLSGYTPRPIDIYGRAQKEIAKTALGAEQTISWEYHKNTANLLKKLKASGVQLIAIEQSLISIDYKKIKTSQLSENVCFIVGNEVTGLPQSILKYADIVAEIPMKGEKESLNVAVSAGIVLFRILNI